MLRLPTAAVAAGSLVLGYAVADLTGLRWLGGLVLVAGAALCWQRWSRTLGVGGAAALIALYVVGFVVVHLIASTLGGWPACCSSPCWWAPRAGCSSTAARRSRSAEITLGSR